MIAYSFYESLEHKSLITKHLHEYNITFTGIRPEENIYFYVLEDERLKGMIYAHLGWDWVTLSDIYYEDLEILKLLFSKICLHFKKKASGITYDCDDMIQIHDFYQIGFTNNGIIDKTEKAKELHFAIHTSFDIVSDSSLKVIQTSKLEDKVRKELKEILSLEEKKETTDVIFVARDSDGFVGGVHGVVTNHRMYIGVLVVIKKYRGQKIGSKIMDLIEKKALSIGVASICLGTCDFQAKPFYEKRGYSVISTLHNYPKGFNEYTLLKKLG